MLAQKLFQIILNNEFSIKEGEDEADWVERMVHKDLLYLHLGMTIAN
ncbi:hypothetical protein [Scytonema hofmannii]|nr:hypothetical protein [Scytonema hofmannii]